MRVRELVFLGAISASTAAATAFQAPENIALSGTSGPLGPGIVGRQFAYFTYSAINEHGDVVLPAPLVSIGFGPPNSGIWLAQNGSLTRIVLEYDPAPGVPGTTTFSGFFDSSPGVTSNGRVLFSQYLSSTTLTSNAAYSSWAFQPAGLTLVARGTTQAPGFALGTMMNPLGALMMNAGGTVAFNSGLGSESSPGPLSDVVWHGPAGSATALITRGGQAPGLSAGITVSSVNLWGLSDSGHVVVTAFLSGPGVTSSNNRAIYRSGPGGTQLIARLGDQPPGIEPSRVFVDFNTTPSINNVGQVAFIGFNSGPFSFPFALEGVWAGEPGNVVLAARRGSQVPGQPAGFTYGRTYPNTPVCLSDSGAVALRMDAQGPGVTGASTTSLFAGLPGDVRLVARDGTRLPGTPQGVVVAMLGLGDPSINASGHVAFTATLSGPGIDSSNQQGLWAGRPGGLRLIARSGQTLLCGDGQSRVVSSINFTPGQNGRLGRGCGLANNGWLAFTVQFTGGGGGAFRVQLPNCDADIGRTGGLPGGDGTLDNNDFIVFIDMFFAGSDAADIGEAGGVPGGDTLLDNNDFIVFIDRFFTGC